jgi:hypothetical protein
MTAFKHLVNSGIRSELAQAGLWNDSVATQCTFGADSHEGGQGFRSIPDAIPTIRTGAPCAVEARGHNNSAPPLGLHQGSLAPIGAQHRERK